MLPDEATAVLATAGSLFDGAGVDSARTGVPVIDSVTVGAHGGRRSLVTVRPQSLVGLQRSHNQVNYALAECARPARTARSCWIRSLAPSPTGKRRTCRTMG